jgi:hypothetical protein
MELFQSEVETRLPASFAIAFPIAVPRTAFPVSKGGPGQA